MADKPSIQRLIWDDYLASIFNSSWAQLFLESAITLPIIFAALKIYGSTGASNDWAVEKVAIGIGTVLTLLIVHGIASAVRVPFRILTTLQYSVDSLASQGAAKEQSLVQQEVHRIAALMYNIANESPYFSSDNRDRQQWYDRANGFMMNSLTDTAFAAYRDRCAVPGDDQMQQVMDALRLTAARLKPHDLRS